MQLISPLTNELLRTTMHIDRNRANQATGTVRVQNCQAAPAVLIIEDNDVVSDFLQSALEAFGFRALLATNPQQAIEHCGREGYAIQALIADIRLGAFDGFETARTLMRSCPGMQVVFTSGYPYEYLVRLGLVPEKLDTGMFLQKPFLPSEILSALKFLHRAS